MFVALLIVCICGALATVASIVLGALGKRFWLHSSLSAAPWALAACYFLLSASMTIDDQEVFGAGVFAAFIGSALSIVLFFRLLFFGRGPSRRG